jgi:type I restriction enzyme R subunit
LNKDRFRDAIDDFLFTSKTPKISDTLKLLEIKPKLTERNNIGRRIIQKVQDFVDVFIDGVASLTINKILLRISVIICNLRFLFLISK